MTSEKQVKTLAVERNHFAFVNYTKTKISESECKVQASIIAHECHDEFLHSDIGYRWNSRYYVKDSERMREVDNILRKNK